MSAAAVARPASQPAEAFCAMRREMLRKFSVLAASGVDQKVLASEIWSTCSAMDQLRELKGGGA